MYLPCDNPRERRISTSNTEERAKVLSTPRRRGDVDTESNEDHSQSYQNERRAFLNLVGYIPEYKQNDS